MIARAITAEGKAAYSLSGGEIVLYTNHADSLAAIRRWARDRVFPHFEQVARITVEGNDGAQVDVIERDYGFATVTFTHPTGKSHDVNIPFTFAVKVDDLDASELAWEAAEIWPDADWHMDKPEWSATNVTVTVNGSTTVLY